MKQPPGYLSYLLRLWQSGRKDKAIWRASLENPMIGERLSFTNLQDLFTFLEAQTDSAASREFKMDKGDEHIEKE